MGLTEDEIIKNLAKQCGHCNRNTLLLLNINLLAFHVDIM